MYQIYRHNSNIFIRFEATQSINLPHHSLINGDGLQQMEPLILYKAGNYSAAQAWSEAGHNLEI
jgi:hypothetical protein